MMSTYRHDLEIDYKPCNDLLQSIKLCTKLKKNVSLQVLKITTFFWGAMQQGLASKKYCLCNSQSKIFLLKKNHSASKSCCM